MKLKTIETKLKKHNNKQFINYVKCWLDDNKQPLIDILEELELKFNKKDTMNQLIIQFRQEITDYILEIYYNG